jgi:lactate dehydrogenase-like 2-hydroxyacid dehydrogenase
MKVIAVTKNPDKYNKDKANIVDYGNDDNRNYNNSKTDYFVDDIRGLQHLPESLSQADYISIHTPLTDETLEMISHDEISVMKKQLF